MRKQVPFINSTLSLAVASILTFSTIIAYGQTSALGTSDTLQQQHQNNVPQAELIYNNHIYDMSPFISVNNGILNKIQFPALPDNDPKLKLEEGSIISFHFNKQPLGVDAFVIDYDGDIPSIHVLNRVGSSTFELKGPQGLYDLEVHALFSDGQYTSHTILADIVGSTLNDGRQSSQPQQSTQADTTGNNNINNQIMTQQPCDMPAKLQVIGVQASNQKTMNGPTTVLDNNLGTKWSPNKGIDIMSLARKHGALDSLVNNDKNPWIQLDLGTQRSLCTIGIAFDNGEKSIIFFTIQTSTDGVHFRDLGTAQSTPISSGGSMYTFPDRPDTVRYVRITNLGDILGGPPSITELIAVGK